MSKAIIIALIGSGILSTIINQFCNWRIRVAEAKNGTTKGLRPVLKDRLWFLCTRYICVVFGRR